MTTRNLTLRKTNVSDLVNTGVLHWENRGKIARIGPDGKVTEEEDIRLVTSPDYFGGESEEVSVENLLEFVEIIAASYDVPFKFWYDAKSDNPWHGGIFLWQEPIPLPDPHDQEAVDAFNAKEYPVEYIEGRWTKTEPEILVYDRDFPNLFCQLLVAMIEIYGDDFTGST